MIPMTVMKTSSMVTLKTLQGFTELKKTPTFFVCKTATCKCKYRGIEEILNTFYKVGVLERFVKKRKMFIYVF